MRLKRITLMQTVNLIFLSNKYLALLLNFLNFSGLINAATASRLPYDKMTFEEVNLFHDIVSEDNSLRSVSQIESYKTFLFIRNKIVNIFKLFFRS